jgi:hypothetical protein
MDGLSVASSNIDACSTHRPAPSQIRWTGLTRLRRAVARFTVALSMLVVFASAIPGRALAADPPASWRIALLHVTYSDTTATYTPAQLTAAAAELHNYFSQISRGQTDLEVIPVEVSLPHTQEYYFSPPACLPAGQETRNPCPPDLIQDAAQAAVKSLSGVNGISILSTFCGGDVTFPAQTRTLTTGTVTLGVSLDFECPGPAPGPSTVVWGGWAHEFGHQLENAAYGQNSFSFGNGGHPSGYASGYDQMDSCYPCDAGAYSLLGPNIVNGTERVFGGWLSPQAVTVTSPPGKGQTTTATVVLAPLEETSPTTPQVLKIPVSDGIYYLVEVRKPIAQDQLQNYGPGPARGIYDTGVHILQIQEAGDPPVRPINACDTTDPKGCVYSSSDSRSANCNATTRPAYCWPFDLWHVGETFTDAGSGVQIAIQKPVGDGFQVQVTQGTPPGFPHNAILPWDTAPEYTYETVDIWVDSSCNGYEDVVGPKGLLYGRRADGTVIGNGDDPCANHENRVYANVRNLGGVTATNVVVHFSVSNPLGTGMTGDWSPLGTATIPTLAAGATTSVSVTWTPKVTLTAQQQAATAFAFHSCIQVTIDPVPGEIVTAGHLAQENFDNFTAQQTTTGSSNKHYEPIHGQFYVALPGNLDKASINLNVMSRLPKGWTYKVGDGSQTVNLDTRNRSVNVPVDIQIPPDAPVGQGYELSVQALTETTIFNAAIPANAPVSQTHHGMKQVGGVVLSARGVLPSAITLAATASQAGVMTATGTLNPAETAVVAIDFTDPLGNVFTRTAKTDAGGHYTCSLSNWQPNSAWKVRAFWQGDLDHAPALSPQEQLQVQNTSDVPGSVSLKRPAYSPCT